MTINRPTLNEQKQVRQALHAEKHPTAFALGVLVGILLLSLLNIAASAFFVFLGLNMIAGFGLSFAQVVGIGFVLAQAAPSVTANAS